MVLKQSMVITMLDEKEVHKSIDEEIAKITKKRVIQYAYQMPFNKVEYLLYNYTNFKEAIILFDDERVSVTKRFISIINEVLDQLKNSEVFYEIIPMKYFQGKSHEEIAEYFHCDVKTIYRQKKKLIERLRNMLFSDNVIKFIYFTNKS